MRITTKKNRKMNKYTTLLFFIFVLTGFVSCEDDAVYTPDERFVLQAYLYANEPVSNVKVNYAIPLTSSDSVGAPINNAEITLYKNDVAYNLVSSSDTGTYHYPGNDLIINTGETFYIEATVDNKMVSATTTVPDSPKGVKMSTDRIELPEVTVDPYTGRPDMYALREILGVQGSVQLEVIWDNLEGDLHFVVIENAEDDQESIFPDMGGKFGQIGRGAFQRITYPTRESSYQINFREIKYWGKYVVKVYRVNQEYADLYDNLEQDSRDLNEPPTNIKNGLGIFSAFNSQTVYFEVVKEGSNPDGW
jgi:hypothetical protein